MGQGTPAGEMYFQFPLLLPPAYISTTVQPAAAAPAHSFASTAVASSATSPPSVRLSCASPGSEGRSAALRALPPPPPFATEGLPPAPPAAVDAAAAAAASPGLGMAPLVCSA